MVQMVKYLSTAEYDSSDFGWTGKGGQGRRGWSEWAGESKRGVGRVGQERAREGRAGEGGQRGHGWAGEGKERKGTCIDAVVGVQPTNYHEEDWFAKGKGWYRLVWFGKTAGIWYEGVRILWIFESQGG